MKKIITAVIAMSTGAVMGGLVVNKIKDTSNNKETTRLKEEYEESIKKTREIYKKTSDELSEEYKRFMNEYKNKYAEVCKTNIALRLEKETLQKKVIELEEDIKNDNTTKDLKNKIKLLELNISTLYNIIRGYEDILKNKDVDTKELFVEAKKIYHDSNHEKEQEKYKVINKAFNIEK